MNGKGLPLNDGSAGGGGWNTFLVPSHFSADKLGANWIDPDLLGPLGVGNLAKVPGIVENALDNRHISEDLLLELCFSDNGGNANEGMSFREYFKVLVEIAWPRNAKLNICCSQPAGVNANATEVCLQPDFVFTCEPEELHGADFQPLALAPHFLTEKFEHGQQEALTAVLIAKYNTVGQHLVMDLLGHFNLGAGKCTKGCSDITQPDRTSVNSLIFLTMLSFIHSRDPIHWRSRAWLHLLPRKFLG